MIENTAKDAWELEKDSVKIVGENINPEVPRNLWGPLVWRTIRDVIEKSETKEEVFQRMKLWNTHNNPQLPETELIKKVLWALQKWDTKFKRAQ